MEAVEKAVWGVGRGDGPIAARDVGVKHSGGLEAPVAARATVLNGPVELLHLSEKTLNVGARFAELRIVAAVLL
jgi:hypothetical protein